MELRCDSRLDTVTVYARGAQVSRVLDLSVEVPPGDVALEVHGLPMAADPGSFRAHLEGEGRQLVSVSSRVHVPRDAANPSETATRMRELTASIEREQTEIAALEFHAQTLGRLQLTPALKPNRRPEAVQERIEQAVATSTLLQDLLSEIDARLLRLRESMARLYRDQQEMALQHAQSTTQSRAEQLTERHAVILLSGEGAVSKVTLVYTVPARWWPVYTVNLRDQARQAEWTREALVAQTSGEDWNDVELALSTADLVDDMRLPELPALRLGKSQPRLRPGFRPAPTGLETLFAAYDRSAFPMATTPVPTHPPLVFDAMTIAPAQSWSADEGAVLSAPPPPAYASAGAGGALGAPQPYAESFSYSPPPPAPMSMPTPMPASVAKPSGANRSLRTRATQELSPPDAPVFMARRAQSEVPITLGVIADVISQGPPGGRRGENEAIEPALEADSANSWLDFDRLVMQPPGAARRGRLVPDASSAALVVNNRSKWADLDQAVPAGVGYDPKLHRGAFDRLFHTLGPVQIPSDGLTHSVPLEKATGPCQSQWRTVPCHDSQVFREVEVANPFPTGLMPGPVDVHVEGSLLLTSTLEEQTGTGGTMHVGLGVEERLRVARNVHIEEEKAGFVVEGTNLMYTVRIEVASALGSPSSVEVVDRLPVTDDKNIKIKLMSSQPEAQTYTQSDRGATIRGGLRWLINVPPGGRASIEYKYKVSFAARNELVGGSRRD